MKNPCSGYLCARIIVGLLDIISDVVLCVFLVLEGSVIWASHLWAIIICGWVLIGFIASFITVIIEKCKRGVSFSLCKYVLLSLKIHAEHGQAFFQSGPQLVTQLGMLWCSGLHSYQFQVKSLLKNYFYKSMNF